MITTTLNKIRIHSPCENGWKKLLKSLGKEKADDEPLKFSVILKSNGINDALWCLRSVCPDYEKEVRLLAADCAEAVLHIFEKQRPHDNRPRMAIEAARKFANGEIDDAACAAARAAARAAAWDAAGDAAAESAACAAVCAAAESAVRAAAWDTVWDAVWAAAESAVRAAAWDTVRAAVWDTVWDAAGAAAWDAQAKILTDRFS